MFTNITVEELIPLVEKNKMNVIDVRSPSEYADFHFPGSVNIPFFTDEERAEVGTIYTQVGDGAARERGLYIISQKLTQFIKKFQDISGEKTVYCWRGGMRSKTTATLLDLMNIHVHRLDGGIRAYRKWVLNEFNKLNIPNKAFVLSGLTGTGKTRILRKLEKEGFPVIDLEKIANHKGSIFGHIGEAPNNQKTFDSLLLHRLRALKYASYLLFEAESSRIGKITLPHFLLELKGKGQFFIIDIPIEERINIILEDYQPWFYKRECLEAFKKIKSRIHTPIAKQIEEEIQADHYSSAIRLLLEFYYDKRYKHVELESPEQQKITIKVKNLKEAVEILKESLSSVSVK